MIHFNFVMVFAALAAVSFVSPAPAMAQNQTDKTEPQPQGNAAARENAVPVDEDSSVSNNDEPDVSQLDAPAAVREGNRLLRSDELTSALRAYEHAQSIEPDAREIDFVQGLAHFKNGAYELARHSFEDAATASSDKLVDDALYSVGTTYHAEALARQDDPQEAFPLLEQAMKRYQEVLAHQPDHQAAKDANYRAASKWRVIKKMLEEQQQQQEQQNSDDQEKDEDEQQEQQQDDQQKQDQDDEQQEQQQDPSEQDEQQQDQQEQDGEPQDQEQDQESQESNPDQENENEQNAEQAKAQQEEVSREDAQRKLRELMQALRDRNENKPKRAERYRHVPVDKDW